MEKVPMIKAQKAENGQVLTDIEGTGGDVLELLAMLNRSIALILLENGNTPGRTAAAIQRTAGAGMAMAMQDRKAGK